MKGTRIQQMFRQIVTLVFMVCRLWRQIPGGATAREDPAHNPRNGPFRPTPAGASVNHTLISEDNQACALWTENPIHHSRQKPTGIAHHAIGLMKGTLLCAISSLQINWQIFAPRLC